VVNAAPLAQGVTQDADQGEPSTIRLAVVLHEATPLAAKRIAVAKVTLAPVLLADEADHADPVDRLAALADGVAPAPPIRTPVVRVAPDVDGEVAPAAKLIELVSTAPAALGVAQLPVRLIAEVSTPDVLDALAPDAAICKPVDRAAPEDVDDVLDAPPRSTVDGAVMAGAHSRRTGALNSEAKFADTRIAAARGRPLENRA
jgi:hypothetical protein